MAGGGFTGVIEPGTPGPSGPVGVSPPVNIGTVGQSLEQLGNIGDRYATHLQDQDNRDAVAGAHMQLSQAATDLMANQEQLKTTIPDDPTGFTPLVGKSIDDYTQNLLSQQTNPYARDTIQQGMAALRTASMDNAMRFEADAKVKYRLGQSDTLGNNYSAYLLKNPDDYTAVRDNVMVAIENMALPPDARLLAREKIDKQLTEAAAMGLCDQNPRLCQRFVNERLGLTPDDTPAAAGAAPAGTAAAPGAAPAGATPATSPTGTSDTPVASPASNPFVITPQVQLARDQAGLAIKQDELAKSTDPTEQDALRKDIALTQAYINTSQSRIDAQAPQTPAQYASAQANAIVDVPPATPASPDVTINVDKTVNVPYLDRLNAAQLLALKNHADTLVRADAADAQASVRAAWNTGAAQSEAGVVPTIPDSTTMMRAFGPGRAAEEATKFQTLQRYAIATQSASTMTIDQLDAQTAKLAPTSTDDPEWAQKQRESDAFMKARNAIVAARDKDPIQAAADQTIGKINELNTNDPQAFVDELKNRQAIALAMHDKYGQASYTPFTNIEAAGIKENFHTLTSTQQLGFLAALRAGLPAESDGSDDVYTSAVNAFAKDSPPIRAAADFAGRGMGAKAPDGTSGTGVALQLLQGDRILNPDKYAKSENGTGRVYQLPPTSGAGGMDAYIAQQLGPAFMQNAEAFNQAKQGIYAHYAYQAQQAGAYNEPAYDSNKLDRAIDTVVGQRSKWATGWFGLGGQPVLMPWGMKEDDFKQDIQKTYDSSMTAAGLKGSSVDRPGDTNLIRLDEYHYGLRQGNNVVSGRGGPVVLDITPSMANP